MPLIHFYSKILSPYHRINIKSTNVSLTNWSDFYVFCWSHYIVFFTLSLFLCLTIDSKMIDTICSIEFLLWTNLFWIFHKFSSNMCYRYRCCKFSTLLNFCESHKTLCGKIHHYSIRLMHIKYMKLVCGHFFVWTFKLSFWENLLLIFKYENNNWSNNCRARAESNSNGHINSWAKLENLKFYIHPLRFSRLSF